MRSAALLLVLVWVVLGDDDINSTASPVHDHCSESTGCTAKKDGLILPVWRPFNPDPIDRVARGFVYFIALCYMFLGVSIVSDRFMSAIEVITSQEKEVQVKRPNGESATVSVRIWNETVSNLSLMALGSSAPEIMLSVIEVTANRFKSGDLGPGTIVGSAAFNLFCIIAICVYVIPDGEVRRIEHLRVFVCTAIWSILAYVWLYLIISVISPKRVDVWEGLLTFAFFPILVAMAYATDRKIFFMKFLDKRYTVQLVARDRKSMDVNGDVEMQSQPLNSDNKNNLMLNHEGSRMDMRGSSYALDEWNRSEQQMRDFIKKLHELKEKNPDLDDDKLEQMAAYDVLQHQHKSRAYYRIAATRKMTGGGNVLKKNLEKKSHERADAKADEVKCAKVMFEPAIYTVMENVGSFEITVTRQPADAQENDLEFFTYVDFQTVDGTANQGSDFHYAEGTLVFQPGDTEKTITLHIVDDDVFEEDEHFSVKLNNLRSSRNPDDPKSFHHNNIDCRLMEPITAVITILDDDHCGVFAFEHDSTTVHEDVGEMKLKVVRHSGARGNISLPYRTSDATATEGTDYTETCGELKFVNDETWKLISIPIHDSDDYDKNVTFNIELGHPRQLLRRTSQGSVYAENFPRDESELTEDEIIALQGRPKLGLINRCNVTITAAEKYKGAIDKLLMGGGGMGDVIGTSSWKEQFLEALSVSAGGDDDEDGEEGDAGPALPSCMDYVMHFLTIFWKLLFAFIPPTSILGGWPTFVVSIFGIGVLTALIGDLASHFGCTVGLRDAVTAISFVALGTSIPDTFASKTAAIGDDTADASVGNVTGSNAVNVFLGIGLAWSVAAVYHYIEGTPGGFYVDPGTLAYSVTVFCILALICILTLSIRRVIKPLGGAELGGPTIPKTITAIFFIGLWITYIVLSALVSYCVISGF